MNKIITKNRCLDCIYCYSIAEDFFICVRKNTKQRVRNIAEDVSFEEIINYLLDVYESREQDVPSIYEYLEMDVL